MTTDAKTHASLENGFTFSLLHHGEPVYMADRCYSEKTSVADALKAGPMKKKDWRLLSCSEAKISVGATRSGRQVAGRYADAFFSAICDSYWAHYHLILRPDDVWLAIMLHFADFVNEHPGEMRGLFVDHQGKMQLVLEIDNYNDEEWPKYVEGLGRLAGEQTKGDIREWAEPRFSTTTDNDRFIGRVALLGSLKRYFAYALQERCGLPRVTLEGTPEDWREVRRRADRLAEFGEKTGLKELVWWHRVLVPILDEFVASREGHVNAEFWQRCADSRGWSGYEDRLSGWALAFAPFKDGQWRLRQPEEILKDGSYGEVKKSELATRAVEIFVKLNILGQERDICVCAGSLVCSCDDDYDLREVKMRPAFDYGIYEMPRGTIKDPIDWEAGSGKVLPPSSADDRPQSLSLPNLHLHTLKFDESVSTPRSCGVCDGVCLGPTYACEPCSFDCCLRCADRAKARDKPDRNSGAR